MAEQPPGNQETPEQIIERQRQELRNNIVRATHEGTFTTAGSPQEVIQELTVARTLTNALRTLNQQNVNVETATEWPDFTPPGEIFLAAPGTQKIEDGVTVPLGLGNQPRHIYTLLKRFAADPEEFVQVERDKLETTTQPGEQRQKLEEMQQRLGPEGLAASGTDPEVINQMGDVHYYMRLFLRMTKDGGELDELTDWPEGEPLPGPLYFGLPGSQSVADGVRLSFTHTPMSPADFYNIVLQTYADDPAEFIAEAKRVEQDRPTENATQSPAEEDGPGESFDTEKFSQAFTEALDEVSGEQPEQPEQSGDATEQFTARLHEVMHELQERYQIRLTGYKADTYTEQDYRNATVYLTTIADAFAALSPEDQELFSGSELSINGVPTLTEHDPIHLNWYPGDQIKTLWISRDIELTEVHDKLRKGAEQFRTDEMVKNLPHYQINGYETLEPDEKAHLAKVLADGLKATRYRNTLLSKVAVDEKLTVYITREESGHDILNPQTTDTDGYDVRIDINPTITTERYTRLLNTLGRQIELESRSPLKKAVDGFFNWFMIREKK